MKTPDLDQELSKQTHTLVEFVKLYNKGIPTTFPRATKAALEEYKNTHAEAFKVPDAWSLDLHRKKLMDWLRVSPA